MTAIDFQSLMRQERKKSRQKSKESSSLDSKGRIKALPEDKESVGNEQSGPSWSFQQQRSLYSLTPFDSRLHRVCNNPPSIYYVSKTLTQEFQRQLCDWLLDLPENPIPSCSDPTMANGTWTTMRYGKRRVALFDQRLDPFPEPLATLVKYVNKSVRREKSDESGINHILINDYASADQGILPHTDGPAYEPCTATLSLESDAILTFQPRTKNENNSQTNDVQSINPLVLLEAGSLVVFRDAAYAEWMHSIPTDQPCIDIDPQACVNLSQTQRKACCDGQQIRVQRGDRRISLTFRKAR